MQGTIFFLLCLFLSLVLGDIVNYTIDDSLGDSQTGQLVTYLPITGAWNNEMCGGCALQPDIDQAFDKTYTAATWHPNEGTMNITMQFNGKFPSTVHTMKQIEVKTRHSSGTAIYVFFTLVNSGAEGVTIQTLANFSLDGNPPQLFTHLPDPTSEPFLYQQLVFSQTSLEISLHTLVISASQLTSSVFVNFDYAMYSQDLAADVLTSTPSTTSPSQTSTSPTSPSTTSTSPTSPSTPSPTPTSASPTSTSPTPSSSSTQQVGPSANENKSSTPTSIIVGGVLGGLIFLALLVILCQCRRRYRQRTTSPVVDVEPFTAVPALRPVMFQISSEDPLLNSVRHDHRIHTAVEDIRRSRQQQIDQSLHTLQNELTSLTPGDMDIRQYQSVRRQGILNHKQHGEGGSGSDRGGGQVEETTIEDMPVMEQLQHLRDQIVYLREQQRSAWAQGLSDDPPPGYESVVSIST